MDGDLSLLGADFEDVFSSQHDINLRTPFRLFDLPTELWLRICEFAVTKEAPILIGREPRLKDSVALARQPAITRTCRLIRREALPHYYSSNTFEILHYVNIPCPRQWLVAIGEKSRLRMQTMTIHSRCEGKFWSSVFERAGIRVEVEPNGRSELADDKRLGGLWGISSQRYLIRFLKG